MTPAKTLRAATVTLLALAVSVGIGACGDDNTSAADSSGQRIDVTVNDQGIDPAEIQASAGELKLVIKNAGSAAHALVVRGENGEVDRVNAIDAGDKRTLRVTLDPGTYQLQDPENEAIQATLTVGDEDRTETQTETQTQTVTEPAPTETQTQTVTEPAPTETQAAPTETQTAPAETQTQPTTTTP
ncbi:cupredoxin domain-containing protein [Paraconexibacter sp.]|uniref:cupredoxin domain-containing protein n=1 Tax=Paraconexibacter sp. TaxID=2949640 RepID=UPI0035689456